MFGNNRCDHAYFPVEDAGSFIGQRCAICGRFNSIEAIAKMRHHEAVDARKYATTTQCGKHETKWWMQALCTLFGVHWHGESLRQGAVCHVCGTHSKDKLYLVHDESEQWGPR
jgi:hypothetical protein